MVLLRRFDRPELYRGGYVSIGNFDGVHRGHQEIAGMLTTKARADGAPSVVLTFDPHPLQLLRPEHVPPALTTVDYRAELLERIGVTCVVAYPTDRALLQLTPEQFFDKVLVSELQAKGVVEGPNFCFGKDRKGNIGTLQDLCQARNVSLEIVAPVEGSGQLVSSSSIRSLIAQGRMAEAVELLGHPYRVRGLVTTGARRGATIGFPTANLSEIPTLLPGDGVYAGAASVDDVKYAAAINVGPNPTFHEQARKFEVHLIDFSGDLYGRSLDVDLFDRIRDTRRFEGREALVAQLALDVQAARRCAQSLLRRPN